MDRLEKERLETAMGGWRRNIRQAMKAEGRERVIGVYASPPEGVDLFDGVDATPAELVAFMEAERFQARERLAAVTRMASIGFAVEMGMHEVNSEMSSAHYQLKDIKKGMDAKGAQAVDRVIDGLDRLKASLYGLSFMDSRGGEYRSSVTGREMHDLVKGMYGHWCDRAKISLEATDAFLKAEMTGRRSALGAAMLNLVRNAYAWTHNVDGKRTIRLDVETYDIHHESWTDTSDGEVYPPRTETRYVFLVEDSGPGVPEDMHDKVFLPFVSGRRSRGIGLYLTKTHLEASMLTAVLAPERSDLGGAKFKVGARDHLEPMPRPEPSAANMLAAVGIGIAEMIEDGRMDDVLRMHRVSYGEIRAEQLRIEIDGTKGEDDDAILEAAGAIEDAIQRHRVGPSMR